MKKIIGLLLVLALVGCSTTNVAGQKKMENTKETKKIVVAHRGASGYLPEHIISNKM